MRALDAGFLVCESCHKLNRPDDMRCTRCDSELHARKPNSIVRCFALCLSAVIFYFPANMLDVMTVVTIGSPSASATILDGVVELVQGGMLPIGLVVLFASILVPSFKLVGLFYLMFSLKYPSQWFSARHRATLYRVIAFVGRWSMLDIFVICILVTLVNLGNLSRIEVGPAAIPFCTVVIITMFATLSFDPRLIWDYTAMEQETDEQSDVQQQAT